MPAFFNQSFTACTHDCRGLWGLILGAVVVVARLTRAIALMANSGVTAGRLLGTLGTVIPAVVSPVCLILLAVGKL